MRRRTAPAPLLLSLLLGALPASAQEPVTEIRAVRAASPPRLDGLLDDEVWSGARDWRRRLAAPRRFNRQFFLRLIAQLDTGRRRVLGDALASYEPTPGTVVYLGYGSILESDPGGRYAPTARARFFKGRT